MRPILLAFALLLCTCVNAQSGVTAQSEIETKNRYTYSLRTTKIDRKEVVAAFAEAAGITVHARFTGDWTTSDDDGIEYYLNTRRNRLSIEYGGKDEEVSARAKAKVVALQQRLNLDREADN